MRPSVCKEENILFIGIPVRKVELCLLRKYFAGVLQVETEILRAGGGWDTPNETKGGFCLQLQKGSRGPGEGGNPGLQKLPLPVAPPPSTKILNQVYQIHRVVEVMRKTEKGAEYHLQGAVGPNDGSISGRERSGQRTPKARRLSDTPPPPGEDHWPFKAPKSQNQIFQG